jgi:biotin synthase
MFMAYSLLFWNFLMSQSQVLEKPLIQVGSVSAPQATPADGDWTVAGVEALFDLPFNDLLFRAQEVHRAYFPEGDVELAT